MVWARRAKGLCILGVTLVAFGATSLRARQAPSRATPPAEPSVACRALEVNTDPQSHLTVVVFHHRDAGERERLGHLLRQHSGAVVEVQLADGTRRKATLFRMKSCFGRGLLLVGGGAAHLAAGDAFVVDFPAS